MTRDLTQYKNKPGTLYLDSLLWGRTHIKNYIDSPEFYNPIFTKWASILNALPNSNNFNIYYGNLTRINEIKIHGTIAPNNEIYNINLISENACIYINELNIYNTETLPNNNVYITNIENKAITNLSNYDEKIDFETFKTRYEGFDFFKKSTSYLDSPVQFYGSVAGPRSIIDYSENNNNVLLYNENFTIAFNCSDTDNLNFYYDPLGLLQGMPSKDTYTPLVAPIFSFLYENLTLQIRIGQQTYYGFKKSDLIYILSEVFGIKQIAYTVEDAINKVFDNEPEIPTDAPEIPTDAPEQTAPGQENNEIINNGGGTGDSTSDVIEKETHPTGTAGGLTNSYILNYNEILKIQGELYKPSFIKSLNALNFNLQDCILSLMIYPFNIIENTTYSEVLSKTVHLGEYDVVMEHEVYKIAPSSVGKFKVGEITLKPYFGNFLDFSSTAMKIYLPYLGFYEIDSFDVYTNEKLTVYYTVEFETGRVKATIENEAGNIINYYSGQIGIQLSFVGSNFGDIMKNVIFSTITGGLNSNLGGFTAGAEKVLNSEMTHNGGTDGSSIERFMPQKPYLMIMHPDTVIPTNYNKTVGRPSLITITLNKIKGYTEVENPILNIPGATETELNEIVSIMKNGFRIQ